jgi:hypothetical protein
MIKKPVIFGSNHSIDEILWNVEVRDILTMCCVKKNTEFCFAVTIKNMAFFPENFMDILGFDFIAWLYNNKPIKVSGHGSYKNETRYSYKKKYFFKHNS